MGGFIENFLNDYLSGDIPRGLIFGLMFGWLQNTWAVVFGG